MNDLVRGAAAGAAATVPMTWAMEVLHRLLPIRERYPLPPREITEQVARAVGIDRDLDDPEQFWLALASHFGYGATVGTAYGIVAPALPGRPIVKGTAYGLAMWAGSYLGLLPALGILTPATRHTARRTGLMIAAHVVWGSALGIFADLLQKGSRGDSLHSLGATQKGENDGEYARHPEVPGEAATTGTAAAGDRAVR